MFSVSEICDLAIRIEKNGEKVYRQALAATEDPVLRELFRWLAEEESRHIQWFSRFREEHQRTGMVSADPVDSPELLNILGRETFSLNTPDLTSASPEEVIEKAVEFEQDTALFYGFIQAFVQDPAIRGELDEIIAEEERHAENLKKSLRKKIDEPLGDGHDAKKASR